MSEPRPGLRALYAEDRILADRLVFGRESDPSTRRGFLRSLGLGSMAAAIGAPLVHARSFPAGLIPAGLLDRQDPFELAGKDGLVVLNDRPINAETPAHLLDDEVTPNTRMFVRNNGHPPTAAGIDPATWTIEIGGESIERPTAITLAALREQFDEVTLQLTIECAGNGRSEFHPPTTGIQWTTGAVGCPRFTGVRLRDVLGHCGVKSDAVYVGYEGADVHLSGDQTRRPISRGVPIAKAMEAESLLAFSMNGEDLPWLNGHPLRMITAGWPASTGGKWLRKLLVRDRVHDGEKMGGDSYRMPRHPVAPGSEVPESDLVIIESMPVKSLVTAPRSGATVSLGDVLTVRGHAWAGDLAVAEVSVSKDFGATWQPAALRDPVNRFAWQHWTTELRFDQPGYYEIWARSVDTEGRGQPMVLPGWNPKGYLNNACHRIAVLVET